MEEDRMAETEQGDTVQTHKSSETEGSSMEEDRMAETEQGDTVQTHKSSETEGSSMEEDRMAETEQGDTVSSEGEPSVDISNKSPVKRGRGRPQGSKKQKVGVTDVNPAQLVSANSNGGSTQPSRGRGRPKLSTTKHTKQQASRDVRADTSVQTRGSPRGSRRLAGNEDSSLTVDSPKKRGRPRKPLSKDTVEKAAAEDLPNGRSVAPKRGRPKGSRKRKSESLTRGEDSEGSSVTQRKRGRPKGSSSKKPRLERELSSEEEEEEEEADGSLNSQRRGRGRPRKVEVNDREAKQETLNGVSETHWRGKGAPRRTGKKKEEQQELVTGGSQPAKRGRGRPKGSSDKKVTKSKVRGKVGRPPKAHVLPAGGKKRSRPQLQPAKRGRPRKSPLPPAKELKKPKVWKPLGRPRKYPRVDPPEGVAPAHRRSRGRPRKSESKKGAHLRKGLPASPSTPHDDGPLRESEEAPQKRGRPKGSVVRNKASSEKRPNSTRSDSPGVGAGNEAEQVEREAEHGDDTEQSFVDQGVSFDVSNQA